MNLGFELRNEQGYSTRAQLAFLAEASKVLASSLDYDTTLTRLSQLIVPRLADWCTIAVVEEDGYVRCLGAAHSDPIKQETVSELTRRYWTEFSQPQHVLNRVIKSGQSEVFYEFNLTAQPATMYYPEHQQLLARLGINSLMVVPLLGRGEVLGAVVLVKATPDQCYDPADLEVATELALRAASAIDNARLYQKAQSQIAQRELAEQALRNSEERLRLALQAGGVSSWDWNLVTDVVQWSDNMEQLFGLPTNSFDGKSETFFRLVHPDDASVVEQAVQRAIKEHDRYDLEVRISRPDGKLLWISIEGQVFYDESNQPTRMLGITKDITDRKQVEERLRESEEQMLAILDNSSANIYVKDREGRHLLINRRIEELYPYPRAEWLGKTDYDFFDKEMADIWRQNDLEVFESGQATETEEVLPEADGLHTYLSLKFPLKNAKGEIYAICGISTDITARKRAEERERFLSEASKVLSSSLDYEDTLQSVAQLMVPDLAEWCTVHMQGAEQNRAQPHQLALAHKDPAKIEWARDVQRYMEIRYPYDPHAPNGLPKVLREGIPELYPAIPDELLVQVAQDEEQLKLLREIGYSSVMIVPMMHRGQILGAIQFVATTESGRHYDEDDLAFALELGQRAAMAVDNARLYREARQAIQIREEFLSVAAHELKTPITGMRGFAQLLTRQLSKSETLDPVRVNRALANINEQSEKLVRLVSQLLDISRIEAGRLALETKLTNLKILSEEVIAQAQTRLSSDKHKFVLHSPPSVDALVDPVRFEQVLVNLVDNAIKYSPAGGLIELEISQPEPGCVVLSVTDQGIGIPPENRDRIFERFYQAHERAYLSGMGLGLYITRQIVELHNGQIEAHFPEGGGTRFVIRLPTQSE